MNAAQAAINTDISCPPLSTTQTSCTPHLIIENDYVRASVVPGLGAGLSSLVLKHPTHGELHLMRPAAPNVSYFNDLACYVMIPWSNRIEGSGRPGTARLVRGSEEFPLRADWPDGTAIHGVCKDAPFTLLDRSPLSVRCMLPERKPTHQSGWPWGFTAHVRYELAGLEVRCSLTIKNISNAPMPCGGGFHPFWNRRLTGSDACCHIQVPVHGRYESKGMLPVAPAREDHTTRLLSRGVCVDQLDLDDVFHGNAAGARLHWDAVDVTYETCSSCSHTVVYAPPRTHPLGDVFCLEPVTMVNNGFALHARGWQETGVVLLQPGECLNVSMNLNIIIT